MGCPWMFEHQATLLAHGLHNGDAESSGQVLEQEVRFGSLRLGCIWLVSTWVGGWSCGVA